MHNIKARTFYYYKGGFDPSGKLEYILVEILAVHKEYTDVNFYFNNEKYYITTYPIELLLKNAELIDDPELCKLLFT